MALGLFSIFHIARPLTSHAQANPTYVSIHTVQTAVHEGGLATFTLKRTGGSYNNSLTVRVKTWETNHLLPNNATEQFHDVTFPARDKVATLEVLVYKDQLVDAGAPELKAQVQAPKRQQLHRRHPGYGRSGCHPRRLSSPRRCDQHWDHSRRPGNQ